MLNMCFRNTVKVWDPLKVLFQGKERFNNYIVVVLNTPIIANGKESLLLNLWNNAYMRVTVDGGTLCWFSWLKSNNIDETCIHPPDFITGDLDSVPANFLKKVEQKYPQLEVIRTMDQDETDFTKCLRVIESKISECNVDVPTIIVLGDSCGRIDQIMANVNTLFKAKTIVPKSSVYLLGSDSISWLLSEGYHQISIPVSLSRSKSWCSLVPIGSSSIATTTGLKWNLNKGVLEFGKMVSTSNTYNGDPFVTVLNTAPLLWSMEILQLVGNSKEQQTEDAMNVIKRT